MLSEPFDSLLYEILALVIKFDCADVVIANNINMFIYQLDDIE